RLLELTIAKRNEKWMKERGGVEKGKRYYKWFIILHVMFIMITVLEAGTHNPEDQRLNCFLFMLFLVMQIGRIWCIYTLGKFWNTKIIVLPKVVPIKKGPYKYIRHPNYLIVLAELFLIPLLLGAYLSAILFPIVHLGLLKWCIPSGKKTLTKTI